LKTWQGTWRVVEVTANDSTLARSCSKLNRTIAESSEYNTSCASIVPCLIEERLLPYIFWRRSPVKVKVQRLGADNSILAKSVELSCRAKLRSVSLDMLRIWASFTSQLLMTKLFNLVNAEKGSAQAFSLPQKAKFSRSKVVNKGKFKDFGNNVFV